MNTQEKKGLGIAGAIFAALTAAVIILTPGPDGGVFQPGLVYKPGDVIILPARATYVYLGALRGTPDKHIKIIGAPGGTILRSGIAAQDWQYVDIIGDSAGHEIVINSGIKDRAKISEGVGISMEGKVKCILIRGVHFEDIGYGLWAKNELSCDRSINEWVIDSITVEKCTAKNIKYQWAYFGSTNANGSIRPIACNGVTSNQAPGRLGHIRFIDNAIEGTGRASIQISLASEGLSEVGHNRIKYVGREYTDGQGNGVNIGSYSRVRIHDNLVSNTFVSGIAAYAASELIIENNVIDSSGYLDGRKIPWAWGIWIDSRETNPLTKTKLTIRNNKIGVRGQGDVNLKMVDIFIGDQYGDKIGQSTYSDSNVIAQNISSLSGEPANYFTHPKLKYVTVINDPPNDPNPDPIPMQQPVLYIHVYDKNKKLINNYRVYPDGLIEK